jgi:hypothetical protein
MPARVYSCMYCNHHYPIDSPEFEYYREFSERHWAVRHGLVQPGDPMDGRNGTRRDTLGWFARCRDRDRCDQFRRNNHAGMNHFQLEIFSEEEVTTV